MNRHLIISLLAALCCAEVLAQTTDTTDVDIRENPVILFDNGNIDDETVPPYINRKVNRITYNGADWGNLREAIANSSTSPVSIVHIGDSHIQAEIGTSVTREMLQLDFGNAGRGLISPLRLSGTNQPHDYGFESGNAWSIEKIMKAPWSNPMGFNGTSLTLRGSRGNIRLSTAESDESYNPFSVVDIFYAGNLVVTGVSDEYGMPLEYSVGYRNGTAMIKLSRPISKIDISLESKGTLTLFGAAVSNNRPGVIYHAIGNNGATYATYNRIGTTAQGISRLSPNLVIISLGTNEAFGRLDLMSFRSSMDKMVKSVREHNPNAQILLVTPMECDKSSVRRVGRGKRRRRVRTYAVNQNILPLRNEILRYGRENRIAVYDWYAVAGGSGASDKWFNDRLFGGDRIHHTASGYRLGGKLLYEALIKALTDK